MGKCETCKYLHSDKPKAYRWMCMKFPRDEANFVSSEERLEEPYIYCKDINKYGQCKWWENVDKEI